MSGSSHNADLLLDFGDRPHRNPRYELVERPE